MAAPTEALAERARGRAALAFEASEQLRSRQMLDLLARGRVSPAGGVPDSLLAAEQDLRRQLYESYLGVVLTEEKLRVAEGTLGTVEARRNLIAESFELGRASRVSVKTQRGPR